MDVIIPRLGGSPCLVVMRGDSCSKGGGFDSRHHILDSLPPDCSPRLPWCGGFKPFLGPGYVILRSSACWRPICCCLGWGSKSH